MPDSSFTGGILPCWAPFATPLTRLAGQSGARGGAEFEFVSLSITERHGSGTPNFSEGTAFDLPMTVLESVDERWSLGHAFEETEILGANGSGGGVFY